MPNHTDPSTEATPTPSAYITAIKPWRTHSSDVAIQVNGKTVARLSVRTTSDIGLFVGQSWDDPLAMRVREADDGDRAFRTAMALLNRRAKSTRQLAQQLRRKGHSDTVIDRVTERLTQLRLLDDRAFGQAVIRDTTRSRAAGPRLLLLKLRQRGVNGQLAEELIQESTPTPDQAIDQAAQLIQKKTRTPTYRSLEPQTLKRRLWAMLARRGFDHDTIQAAFGQALSNPHPHDEAGD